MRVSIFGMGYVGAVSGACLAELGHTIVGVDRIAAKTEMIASGRSPVVETGVAERIAAARKDGRMEATTDADGAVARTDVSIISVGTPSDASGAPALVALETVVGDIGRAIAQKNTPHAVVVRSTVLPGTTEDIVIPALEAHSGRRLGDGLEVCFNPEFLREGAAVRDFFDPPFTIAGCVTDGGQKVIEGLYAGISAPLVRTTCRIAESVKYISNTYHAIKVTFANEVGQLMQSLGIDAREVMEIFCRDTDLNVSAAYLRPGFAFGGSCLPKELRALQALARRQHLELPMLSQVLASNDRHIEHAFNLISRHGRNKVALFGLAFKAGTDDLRESPLVMLAERLIGKGYELSVYDRFVETARLVGSNRDYIEREIPHFERLMAAEPAEALRDAKVIVVGHVGAEEIEAIVAACEGRTIIDLQGVPQIESLPGVAYQGICW